MKLIRELINRYKKELDYYDQSARLVCQLLERNLQGAGIRAIVTCRAKSPQRLEAKVRQRMPKKKYKSLPEIYKDIIDLAGVRVALYFPGQREEVGKIISEQFILEGKPKVFPDKSKSSVQKKFSGYCATHYRVRIKESSLGESHKRYADALIEIQVASVLMHAWAEVEHDLVYKPMQGELSQDEYAILDELNGIVLAGEIALERLQRAGESRLAAQGRTFPNHFDLAVYLLDQVSRLLKGPLPDSVLGQVDLLYTFIKKLKIATPAALEPYLKSLSADLEKRPLAEQLIDRLLAEDPKRYELLSGIRHPKNKEQALAFEFPLPPHEVQIAIGIFLSRWSAVERLLRNSLRQRGIDVPPGMPITKLLSANNQFGKDFMDEMDLMRRFRNNLVHGIEYPDAATVKEATTRLASLVSKLHPSIKSKGKQR